MEPSNRYGPVELLAANIVCCGAIVLAATGAISFAGLVSWLVGGGYFWLAASALTVAGIYWWRRSAHVNDNEAGKGHVSHPPHGQPE